MPDEVPVICYHAWLPIDKDEVERCRHCDLAYKHSDCWAKGRTVHTRKKVHDGDPRKANLMRPPECGNGDGHPEPIGFVTRAVAFELGILKREAPVTVTVPSKIETKPPETVTKAPENVIHDLENVHIRAPEGRNLHARHKFIETHKAEILADATKMGREKAAELWGISVASVDGIRVEGKTVKHHKKPGPKPGAKKTQERSQREMWDALRAKADKPPSFTKRVDLGNAGWIAIEITGNVLEFNKTDRDFILGLIEKMEEKCPALSSR